jgi:hypothetical protein
MIYPFTTHTHNQLCVPQYKVNFGKSKKKQTNKNTKIIVATFLDMVLPSVWSLVKPTLTSQIIGIRPQYIC